jgi:hypothetical protein
MALNEKMKNKYRRIIRVWMVVVAVALLVMGLAVPIANNAVAMRDSRALKDLTSTEIVTVLESTSLAGRFFGSGGHMQYFAALLVRSDRSLEELNAYYAAFNKSAQLYRVEVQQGQEITVLPDETLKFRETVGENGYYIVYSIRQGGNVAQWWLDMDVR